MQVEQTKYSQTVIDSLTRVFYIQISIKSVIFINVCYHLWQTIILRAMQFKNKLIQKMKYRNNIQHWNIEIVTAIYNIICRCMLPTHILHFRHLRIVSFLFKTEHKWHCVRLCNLFEIIITNCKDFFQVNLFYLRRTLLNI